MPAVYSILSNPNIYDSILSTLSPLTKYRLKLVDRMSLQAVDYFDKRAFNINNHLSYFFTNPISFRNLQKKTGTIISGSNAIQFFDRTFFDHTDLDLYVHPGHAGEVSDWLRLYAGYNYVGSEGELLGALTLDCNAIPKSERGVEDEHDDLSICCIIPFRRMDADGIKLIKVMVTKHSPMHAILHFHSSKSP